jgi:hypothetical protein
MLKLSLVGLLAVELTSVAWGKHADPSEFTLTAHVSGVGTQSIATGSHGGGSDTVWNAPGYGPVVFHNDNTRVRYKGVHHVLATIGSVRYDLVGPQLWDLGDYKARFGWKKKARVVELLARDRKNRDVVLTYEIAGQQKVN